jgi:protein-L-isoaspartate(D-aspartate) O-methyltransferase
MRDNSQLRHLMVDQQLRPRGIRDERLIEAFLRVPRHEFVAPEYALDAYEDHPLPISHGQTISQPYIVAAMLEPLNIQPSDTVLEIGTGSGYVTALLCELAEKVYSIERHEKLARHAGDVLRRLAYQNLEIVVGDGSLGLPDHAPYDVIVVSAAAPRMPDALIQQLADGGRLIAPVGSAHAQELMLVRRFGNEVEKRYLHGCRFVPLVGTQGFPAS